ncbi:type II secretory pathway, component PulF [Desulfosporosinus orientis DSM 765]|uniref:Type II secretory pathway, component PulF n=1 Tax=Desulfosporosinus orientis (strain ATCC 19365 / DSM 765 / NCIMB 8382 / VKM B-1628 / Singapore I) TaxID=768706 RepID=G7W841_DESOD|nr:type II secretion system F family protein [Desulfosporosinus orientis]AET66687.1 type II secretory pathway, component PulF [Desulfosporosinus orientis DSM 765]
MSGNYYFWKAVDPNGKIQRGAWSGDGISEVQTRLRQESYFPISVRSVFQWKNALFLSGAYRWSSFFRRLATLLEAGIPLLQALEIITSSEEKSSREQEQWRCLKEQVEGGNDLSEALALLNPSPNSFILSMVKAGEYTGTVAKVLSEVADELEHEYVYNQQVKAALAYPMVLFATVLLVIYVLSVWVLPMYQKLFLSVGAKDLPFLTKVIFGVSQKLPLIMGGILSLVSVSFLVLRFTWRERWKIKLESILGRMPLVGKIYRLRDLVQFSNMLERLLKAGIPLLEGLRLTAGTLRSPEMLELINQLVINVRQGERMAPLLRESRIFPKEGAVMIEIAEESGELEHMFRYVAQMFRRDLEEKLNRVMRMIGPVLILVVAALVGFVACGVILPIFDLSSHLE